MLLDNGSLRAESTLNLRRIAQGLSEEIGRLVEPVSLLHSGKVPAEELGGARAKTWKRFLELTLAEGASSYVVIPLFFGPSSAFRDYLPQVFEEARSKAGRTASLKVGAPLVDAANPNDDGLARILVDLLSRKLDTLGPLSDRIKVLLVDHGSPLRKVALCRDLVGRQMAKLLEGRVSGVTVCSMERREGDEYAFCDPLLGAALEGLLEEGDQDLLLSLMFFSPGRHAGPGGDIEQIVRESRWVRSGRSVRFCPLVGESSSLIELLAKRYWDAMA